MTEFSPMTPFDQLKRADQELRRKEEELGNACRALENACRALENARKAHQEASSKFRNALRLYALEANSPEDIRRVWTMINRAL